MAPKSGKMPLEKKSTASTSTVSTTMGEITAIQQQLSSSSDLNPISDLIAIVKRQALIGSSSSVKERKDAASAIYRATQILSRSLMSLCSEDKVPLDQEIDQEGFVMSSGSKSTSTKTDAQKAVEDWIRQRWNESIELLCSLLSHEVEAVRMGSLQILVELQVSASSTLTRLHALAAAVIPSKTQDKNPLGQEPQGQWSVSPWRAVTMAMIAGPPSAVHLGSGEAGNRCKVTRESEVPQEVMAKFVASGLEEYDDVRFATLREISIALRRPSPSAQKNPSLRANTLSLLLLLTAIPADVSDINNFLVEEMAVPPLKTAVKKTKGKSKSAVSNLKVVDDGDSDDGKPAAAEDDDDMAGWFSDSDNENARAGATAVEKRTSADKKNSHGLGTAARSAGASKRNRKSFHEGLHSLAVQKAAFSAAWLDLLLPRRRSDESSGDVSIVGGELSLAATHEVLVRLHAQILPHLTKPTLLHDFLVACLDSRGVTSLLALNAIFTLVTKHNLDYPQFYTRLYAMLDATVLHMKYRARFLRLLETFLSSTHLSAALVASFAKRLSRLSLHAPPAAIASVVPFIYNLLKKHPRCLSLVHKEWDGDRLNIGPAGVDDPYQHNEVDPLKTQALDSSLWELASFGASGVARGIVDDGTSGGEAHYLGSVTSLVRILAEPFTRERYSLDDFLDITYGTLFETEVNKTLAQHDPRRKRPIPALAYSLPGGFGAGGANDAESFNRVDIFPSESGRARAVQSMANAEREEEQEMERERQDRKRKLVETGQTEEEDADEREAREAIEALKKNERIKKRKVDQTGTHDLCARLFSFA